MKTRRAWLIAMAMAIVAVIAVNEHLSQRDQLATLRQQVVSLRGQQERVAARAGQPPWLTATRAPLRVERAASAAPAAPGEPAGELPAAPEGREGDPKATQAATHAVTQAAIERRFAAESVDEAWAAPVRRALADRLAVAARASASTVGNVECRASVCRVEVVHRDAEASHRFADVPLAAPGEPSAFDSVFVTPPEPAPQGGFAVTMYLARDGAALVKS
jgi:hypothetical protein